MTCRRNRRPSGPVRRAQPILRWLSDRQRDRALDTCLRAAVARHQASPDDRERRSRRCRVDLVASQDASPRIEAVDGRAAMLQHLDHTAGLCVEGAARQRRGAAEVR